MFTNFSEFMTCLKEARFTFEYIWDNVVAVFHKIAANDTISRMWNGFMDAVAPVHMMIMTLGVIVCLVIAFLGKKLLPLMKFSFFFLLGFVLGTHYLAPLLPPDVSLPPWIIGLVLAIIAGVISRFAYIVSYTAVTAYSMYLLSFYGFYLKLDAVYSAKRAAACIVVALIITVLALIFRKYCEMVGTAVLGAWCAVWLFTHCIYDFTAWSVFRGYEGVVVAFVVTVISVFGSIVQIKTRKRY